MHGHMLSCVVCAALLLFCAVGCQWTGVPNPFAKPKNTAVGITTPAQRIEQLKLVEAKAAKSSPEEQQTICGQLAKQIQHEQDPIVRRQVVRTLGAFSTPVSAAVLKAGLSDQDAEVRIACCEAWGKRGGQDGLEELSRVLASDTNLDVRLAAARALGKTKQPAAVTPLAEVLADADPAMQARAMESLKSVSGKDFGNDVGAWRQYAQRGQADPPAASVADRVRKWFQ